MDGDTQTLAITDVWRRGATDGSWQRRARILGRVTSLVSTVVGPTAVKYHSSWVLRSRARCCHGTG